MAVLIIGASSGIGYSLVQCFRKQEVHCVVASRYPEKFDGLDAYFVDLSQADESQATLGRIFQDHREIDTVVLISGVGHIEGELNVGTANETMAINVAGFTGVAYAAANFFEEKGRGHLIAVTSVAALRGGSLSLSYNATKAFQKSLLEGLKCRFYRKQPEIAVSEVRAGFVDTKMMKAEKPFWVASPEVVADSIYALTQSKKPLVYVLRRWRIVGWLLTVLPSWIYKRLG